MSDKRRPESRSSDSTKKGQTEKRVQLSGSYRAKVGFLSRKTSKASVEVRRAGLDAINRIRDKKSQVGFKTVDQCVTAVVIDLLMLDKERV